MSKEKKNKAKNTIRINDILSGQMFYDVFRHQFKLVLLVMLLILFYINNRYACQKQIIELDKLKKELTDTKYEALAQSSILLERSRQSRIEDAISKKEIDLEVATTPPYLIQGGEEP